MTATSPDPEAFKSLEHANWGDDGVARSYADGFGPLTSQTIEPLLDAAGVQAGMRVLDVATGPGQVAATAAQRGAVVTGIDFSRAMVEQAREAYSQIDFREGDAEALAFPDASFDAVVMNYGLLHLARPDTAIAEACRVLVPGGRFAFAVWAPPDQAVAFGIAQGAIEARGRLDVGLPAGPPFFRFSDPDESRRTLLATGFVEPEISLVDQVWHLPSSDSLFAILLEGTARTRALLRAQTPEALAAIRSAVGEATRAYENASGRVELPMPAVVASAKKP